MAENKKRFAVIPLTSEKGENALPGEILVDRVKGRFYVKREDGQIVSETENLDEKIKEVISNSDIGGGGNVNLSSARRNAYRFFFDGVNTLRLDKNLTLPEGSFYFTVKDVINESINYILKPTKVTLDAIYTGVLENNRQYWVTFYNIDGDALTQLLFTGKRADSIISDAVPADKLLSRIEIETHKDELYLGDRFADLYCKVYAYYADGSRMDVTNNNGLRLDKPDLSTEGTKVIKATFFNIDDGRYAEATKEIKVVKESFSKIVGIDVTPRVILTNDGKVRTMLFVMAHYENGKDKDITNRCVIENFDDVLFNKNQNIKVTTNYANDEVYVTEYTINVEMNTDKEYAVFYGETLMRLSNELDTKFSDVTLFRVREAGDLDVFYNMTYVNIGTETTYEGSLRTGRRLIVEFYDSEYKLVRSYVCRAQYKPDNVSEDELDDFAKIAKGVDATFVDPSLANLGIEDIPSINYPVKDPMNENLE